MDFGLRERVTDVEQPHIRDLPRDPARPSSPPPHAAPRPPGFDGVELHYAHAYTMASFLSARNTRTDGYGGARENRVRLPLEVFQAARAAVSADRFLVGCRYLSDDCHRRRQYGGRCGLFRCRVREGRAWISCRSRAGASSRTPNSPRSAGPRIPIPVRADGNACRRFLAIPPARSAATWIRHPRIRHAIREAGLQTPVVVAGGISTFDQAEGDSRLRRSGHRRRRPTVAGGSRLVPEDAPRTRRRDPTLLAHQLLRGPRPDAQTGHVQALGPRSARRAWRFALSRWQATAARAAMEVISQQKQSISDRSANSDPRTAPRDPRPANDES